MNTRRIRTIPLGIDNLLGVLQGRVQVGMEELPPDTEVVSVSYDPYAYCIVVVIASEEFPVVPLGERPLPVTTGRLTFTPKPVRRPERNTEALDSRPLEVGSWWRHWKNRHEYKIERLMLNAETDEPSVAYGRGGETYVRSIRGFLQEVLDDTGQEWQPRFTLLAEDPHG
jgi:hypothetical protein